MSERIVFMGTPDFAAASLKALISNDMDIAAVVTTPDKPAGRGKKISTSAVKDAALLYNIPVLQPENLKSPAFIDELKRINADLFIVVAFRMLPKEVWTLPKQGTFNLHASLLPQYRGAAPINWAIINGEKETGVTTFFINENIDTGDILQFTKIAIDDTDNAGSIHDKLMQVGADLLVDTAKKIFNNSIKPLPQSNFTGNLKNAPKIFKPDMHIEWNKPAEEIVRLIKGLSPYPCAYSDFSYNGNELSIKLYNAKTIEKTSNLSIGSIITDNKNFIHIVAGNHEIVAITDLQMSGRKRMPTEEFLRGYRFTEDLKLK